MADPVANFARQAAKALEGGRKERRRLQTDERDLRTQVRQMAADIAQIKVDLAAPHSVPDSDERAKTEQLVCEIVEKIADHDPAEVYYAKRMVATGFYEFTEDTDDTDQIKVAAIDGGDLVEGAVYYAAYAGTRPVEGGGDENDEPIYHVTGLACLQAFETTGDEASSEITVKPVNADGSVTGTERTWKVIAE